jgi:steroid 5-alpha reductase family enzyme
VPDLKNKNRLPGWAAYLFTFKSATFPLKIRYLSIMINNLNTPTTTETQQKANRTIGFLLISLSYITALVIGLIVFNNTGGTIWMNLFLADLAATFVIWVSSLLLNNASVYDPYWSVQPIVILPLLMLHVGEITMTSFLLCVVVILWGVRLTLNWVSTFKGLHEQDWRYDQIKHQTGTFYPLVNLLGIQLMPTLIVFACIAPIVYVIYSSQAFTWLILPGLLISLSGVFLEAVADRQMHDFRLKNPGRSVIIREGLWKYSRHPNYLGEIMMWWGAYLVCLACSPSAWMLGLGALVNTALFLFISIPLAEKRLAKNKEGFLEYKQQTRMLLPFPKK